MSEPATATPATPIPPTPAAAPVDEGAKFYADMLASIGKAVGPDGKIAELAPAAPIAPAATEKAELSIGERVLLNAAEIAPGGIWRLGCQ